MMEYVDKCKPSTIKESWGIRIQFVAEKKAATCMTMGMGFR